MSRWVLEKRDHTNPNKWRKIKEGDDLEALVWESTLPPERLRILDMKAMSIRSVAVLRKSEDWRAWMFRCNSIVNKREGKGGAA